MLATPRCSAKERAQSLQHRIGLHAVVLAAALGAYGLFWAGRRAALLGGEVLDLTRRLTEALGGKRIRIDTPSCARLRSSR